MGQVDLYEFKAIYQQEPIETRDCNKCVWVSHTENEEHVAHFCTRYNIRVFHRTNHHLHDGRLWPCRDCVLDSYTYYHEEMTNKQAAEILKNTCLRNNFARGNGKSMATLRYTKAIMKAIYLLETTPDEGNSDET